MQSPSEPLPPQTGCDFLRMLLRGLMPQGRGLRLGQHTAAPALSVPQSLGKAAVNCLTGFHLHRHHHHRPNPTPGGAHALLPASAAGDHREALGNARHVVEDDAQEKDQDAGHQDHSANSRPGGAFHNASAVRLLRSPLSGEAALQRLLLRRDRHHRQGLLLAAGQEAAADVSRQ